MSTHNGSTKQEDSTMANWKNDTVKYLYSVQGDPRLVIITRDRNGYLVQEGEMVSRARCRATKLVVAGENNLANAKARAERHAAKHYGW